MLDQVIEETVEDSEGATETTETQDQIEGEQQPETETDDGGLEDETYYEIGEIQATAKEISEWKKAHEGKKSQDADYTRKSQANADERKKLKADGERLSESQTMLTELEGEIEVMALGDLSKLDMDELRQIDPSEYLRVKEEKEKRSKWRESMTSKLQAIHQKAAQEGFRQLSEQHGWDDKAKFDADSKQIKAYVEDSGIDQREFAKIINPHVMTAILEAAKYRELMKSKPTTTKKVVKAPKTTKPSNSTKQTPNTAQTLWPYMNP